MHKFYLSITPYIDDANRKICDRLNNIWGKGVFREGKTHIKHQGFLKWEDYQEDINQIQEDFPDVIIHVDIKKEGSQC